MRKIVAVGLSILFLVYLSGKVDLNATLTSIKSISTQALLTSLALISVNLLVVAVRLRRILNHFGAKLPFFVAFHASLSGAIASLFLINVVGTVLGRQVVLKATGVSSSLSAFISGYERIIQAIVGGSLAISGGILLMGSKFLGDLFNGLPVIPMIIALSLIGILVLLTARSSFERDLLQRIRKPRRLIELSEIFIFSGLSQVVNIYIYSVILASMGFELPFWKVMAASALVSFAASVPISVNGWGVREISAVYAFGLLGVDASSATALSIAVGLLNTLVVVFAVPVFALSRRIFANGLVSRQFIQGTNTTVFPELNSNDKIDFQNITSYSLGMLLSVLIFFQFQVVVRGTTMTINIGDVFALMGLGLVVSQIAFGGWLNFRVGRDVMIWLALVSVAIYLGLLIGFIRFGAIPWAIGNRGVGWLVVLGYFGSGALFSGQFGSQGIRRLAEVLLLTATVVVIVHLLHRISFALDWTTLEPAPNFEGFSANRNAFAFQLLVTLGLSICFLLPARGFAWRKVGLAVAVIIFAIVATNSLTSYVSLVCLAVIIAISSRRNVLARSCVVAVSGLSFYVSLPWIMEILRFASTAGPSSLSWGHHAFSGNGNSLAEGVPLAKTAVQQLPVERLASLKDSSLSERFDSLQGGLNLWMSHPFFGGGLGAFIFTQISKTGTPLVIHSTFVWIVAEMGLVGLFLTGWIPVMQIKRIWRTFWRRPKRVLGGFDAKGSAIFLLVSTFCIFSLAHEIAYQRIFWFVLGALLAGRGIAPVKKPL